MAKPDLATLARAAEAAADAARREILPRFRNVAVETKADGSPVTEADRAAEQAVRRVLREATPDFDVLGEEFGADERGSRYRWVIDPIDGTIAFSRGLPLFSTLIALLEDETPVLGLIDLPGLGERTLGWRGGGVRRNGTPVRTSQQTDLRRALVCHGDAYCFDLCGERAAFERMAHEIPMLRGYTDAFGHAQVIAGGADAMLDLHLKPWDMAATQILVAEAGGRCETLPYDNGTFGLVFGSAPLVEQLLGFLAHPAVRSRTSS